MVTLRTILGKAEVEIRIGPDKIILKERGYDGLYIPLCSFDYDASERMIFFNGWDYDDECDLRIQVS